MTMTTETQELRVSRDHRKRDRLEYRTLVAVSLLPCLVVATLRRVSEQQPHQPAGETIFAEALSSARAAAGYALLV